MDFGRKDMAKKKKKNWVEPIRYKGGGADSH